MTNAAFGIQPCSQIAREQRWTTGWIAERTGIPRKHVVHAMNGYCRPNNQLREALPRLLNRSLEELFTPEALEPFGSRPASRKPSLL
ncbi:MAG: hypothetical protein EOP28_00355 [Rhodococcus sp. (in: high G+C Gram-positive bacteria)]|nr:MAG: hypothetical protein EOP28_00355 [Rhodococcus sp. (in: high G+C Gram-positive bacteria)]